jgi:hypothetical protein
MKCHCHAKRQWQSCWCIQLGLLVIRELLHDEVSHNKHIGPMRYHVFTIPQNVMPSTGTHASTEALLSATLCKVKRWSSLSLNRFHFIWKFGRLINLSDVKCFCPEEFKAVCTRCYIMQKGPNCPVRVSVVLYWGQKKGLCHYVIIIPR